MVVIFSYLAAWMGRSKIWWPGGLVGFGIGLLLTGMVSAVFFGLVGLVLDYILSKNYKNLKRLKSLRVGRVPGVVLKLTPLLVAHLVLVLVPVLVVVPVVVVVLVVAGNHETTHSLRKNSFTKI